jgi:Tfp pilus assembly protein PilN
LVNFSSIKLPALSKRPAHTLLFITEVKTFRVDVDKAGVLFGNAEMIATPCPSLAKLAECVGAVAANSRPFGRKVWLLYARLPITLLSIPSMQVEGVDEATLMQALQFELEGLTGQSSLDMQLAYRLLSNKDEMSSYWVSQINQLHFEDVQQAVKKAGSTLAGLLHPAGLPLSLSLENPERQDWLRMECWPTQLAALRNHPEHGFNIRLFSFDSRHWHTELEHWLAEQGAVEYSETLLNNKIELLPDTAFNLHLNDVEHVADWLLVWASVLSKKDLSAVPVLRYQSKINKDMLLMASGGSVALLICAGHLSWHLYQTKHFAAEFAALQKVETSITAQRTKLSTEQDKRDKLKAKIDKLKGDSEILPRLIKGLQHRPARLLESLARGRPENLLVESIAVDKDEVKISGISLDATSANELSNYLEKPLSALGWSIIAPTKKNMELFVDGGPWEFEIKLLDLGIDGFNKKPHD